MARSIFDDFGDVITAQINRSNPAAGFRKTSSDPKKDWLKTSLTGYTDRARYTAALLAQARQQEEEEERRRKELEKQQKKQGFLRRNLPSVDKGLKGLKKVGGKALDKTADAGKSIWDASNDISDAAMGAGPAAAGDLKFREDGTPYFDYSLKSVLSTPKNLLDVGRTKENNKKLRQAGVDIGDNAYERTQAMGQIARGSMPEPDALATGFLVDPQTWVPVGGVSKVAAKAGLKLNKAGRVGAAIIEGASPRANVGIAGGLAAGSALSDKLGLEGTPKALLTMGASMVGGGASGFKRNVDPLAVQSPKTAPSGRPIVADSRTQISGPTFKNQRWEPDGIRGRVLVAEDAQGQTNELARIHETPDGWADGLDGTVWRDMTEAEVKREYEIRFQRDVEKKATYSPPRHMANERMWFHSTDGAHDFLDPEFAVARTTQGQGIYLAADPKKSAGSYGSRTFATEFDGNALDLTAQVDTPFWDAIADKLGVPRADEAALKRAKGSSYSTVGRKGEGFTNYNYRDYLIDMMSVNRDLEEMVLSGRFAKLLGSEGEYRYPSANTMAQAVVQNEIGDAGFDAVFHHSPNADGEVLVVINGDKMRTVGEVNNLTNLDTQAATWDDLKGGIRAIPPDAPKNAWRPPGMPDYPSQRPSFREYDNAGGVGEAGQINPELAAMLATTAGGAAIGYQQDGMEGAIAGGGIGLLGGAGLVGATRAFRGGPQSQPNVPRQGYQPSLPGPALIDPPTHTPIENLRVGSQVRNRSGHKIGTVLQVDASGDLRVQAKDGTVSTVPYKTVYSEADYSAKETQRKLVIAQKKVVPDQVMIDAQRADFEDALRHAEALTDSGRLLGRKTGALGRAIDPASKFTSAAAKKTHAAIVASANLVHRGDSVAEARADQILKTLAPLIGEGRTADVRRAGAQLTALAGPSVAGIAMTQATGDAEWQEAGVGLGLLGAGLTSRQQRKGFMNDTPWAKIKPRDPELLTGSIANAKSQDRLIDILQHWDGPEGYAIEALNPNLVAQLQKAKEAWDAIDIDGMKRVNAALAAAGQQPLPYRENHAVLAAYTDKSLRNSGIVKDTISPVDVRSTSFRKSQSIEQQRSLGDTLREAYEKYPELELAGGVRDLLVEQLRQQERIKASALVTGEMINSGLAKRFPSDIELRSMTPEKRAEVEAERAALGKAGGMKMPGVDDVLFAPDVVKTVKDLLVTSAGGDNAVMNWLDGATNVARTALFVGDLNAWTLQGAMTALQNPVVAVRNFFPLVGATAFGQKYADYFKMKHPDLVDKAAKRGARSYEHGGLERELQGPLGIQLANAPGVRNLEERARSFLDVFRLVMQDNIAQQEAFLKKGKLSRVPGSRLALDAARAAPTLGAIGAVATGEELDIPFLNEDMDRLFTLALGVGGSTLVDKSISAGGQQAMNSARVNGRPSDMEVEAGVLGGKMTNRISGTQNRQVAGISNKQAQIERVLLMRSPALTRNALTMAKLAASDLGPEGALARIYLVKTAVMTGAAMAFIHAAKQGRMPVEEDFNPQNPESPFSPESFMRAQLGREGTLSASNPLISLARAFMYNDHASGETEWHIPKPHELGLGLTGFATTRLPDVTGPFTSPMLEKLSTGLPSEEGTPTPGLINRLEDHDYMGVGTDVAKSVMPVSAQGALETGVLQRSALGGRLLNPKEQDPAYNHKTEQDLGVSSAWFGLNHNPESLGREISARKDEEAAARYDGKTYAELNRVERKVISDFLEQDKTYLSAEDGRADQYGAEKVAPIQQYFDAQEAVGDKMAADLALAEERYYATGDGVSFRKRMQELATERRTRMSQVESDLANASAEMRGRDETVAEWLDRNLQPEDVAVEEYYRLFDKATDPATGKLDFDGLERMQEEFLKELPARERRYVESRINGERERTPGQKEYERVKEVTKPYFETRDRLFAEMAGNDPFLQQFGSYSKLQEYIDGVALQNGITNADALSILSRQNPGLMMLTKFAEFEGKMLRMGNPEMDQALTKWYGYSPQEIGGKLDRAFGKLQAYGNTQQPEEVSQYSDVATPRSGFKRRRRFWE
ncbi:MAG: hypothetical protein WC869_16160 [Phycisphaerae bacterium]